MTCITLLETWVCSNALNLYIFVVTLFTGGDYIQDIDVNQLAYCMVHCVSQPPPFFPYEFKLLADQVLSYLNIT